MSTYKDSPLVNPQHKQLFSNSLQPNVSPLGQQSQNPTMLLQPPLPSIITTNNTNNTNNTHIQPIISSTNSGNSIFSNNNTGRQNIPSSRLSPVQTSGIANNNNTNNNNTTNVTNRYQQNPTPHQSPRQSNTTINLPHNILANLDHSALSPRDYTDEEIIERQGEIGLIPYNRGHKLKNRADLIDDKSRLKAPYDIYQDIEYIDTPNNQRCPIIHRFPRNSILKAVEYYDDTEFNPYKDINVGEILGPLVKLEDVIKKPHYKRILNDNSLTHCADFLMERIETEKNFNNIISRLMTVLQGDEY
ncbi:8948_t:CDS:2 [Entrophospora sp. SA101]|nr:8948_t:CDS:2 [Entrophospora sp. SA101]